MREEQVMGADYSMVEQGMGVVSLSELTTRLASIRVVLIETTHPGNIGSVARAMKTMGLSQLVLVNPKIFPDGLATALASGAADVLVNARVVDTLADALQGCAFVIGTSARQRASRWPQVDARAAAGLMLDQVDAQVQVALVFGRESSGLTNLELDACHVLGHVPTNPEYGSLNLAMGVQIFTYELWMQAQQRQGAPSNQPSEKTLATSEAFAQFYDHLQQTLVDIEFLDDRQHDRLMRRFKRLLVRSDVESEELMMLRGVLRSMQRVARLAFGNKEK
jgi:tRNA/rRNA methyltransferase/tRNA (cytidine32/uridine32-2'-O)-methyltransferase